MLLFVAAVLLVALAPALTAQLPVIATIEGNMPGDRTGSCVSRAGDGNGDGVADVAVGEPLAGGTGRVRVFSATNGAILHALVGPTVGEAFGTSVADVGDVDLDGTDDLLIGALGRIEIVSTVTAASVFQHSGNVGLDVAGFGDITGDGIPDFGSAGGAGTYFEGGSFAQLSPFFLSGGSTIAPAGDIDGDGDNEVLTGRPFVSGTGSLTINFADPDFVFLLCVPVLASAYLPTAIMDRLGAAMDRVGDLNGDGADEYAYGSPGSDEGALDGGSVHVASGCDNSVDPTTPPGTVIYFITGTVSGADFGAAIAGVDDVNGDGVPDLAIGAPLDSTTGVDAGSVHVISGADGSRIAVFYGNAGDEFGTSVDGVGDVNGDGLADIVVGAPGFDNDRGITYVLSVCGANRYGVSLAATQTLSFDWLPAPLPPLTAGAVALSGGGPNHFGFVLVSTGRAAVPFAGVTFLVDTAPGHFFISDLFCFDGVGSAAFPVNLNQPLLSGFTLDLQGFEVSGLAPQNLFASNGLEVLFCQ